MAECMRLESARWATIRGFKSHTLRWRALELAVRLDLLAGLAVLRGVTQGSWRQALAFYAVGALLVIGLFLLTRHRPVVQRSRGQRLRVVVPQLAGLALAVLYAAGLLSTADLARWSLLLEVGGLLLIVCSARPILRARRAARAAGASRSDAWLAGAAEVLPPVVLIAARAELRLLSGALTFFRRPPAAERGAVRLRHGGSERVVLWAVMGVGAVECVAVDLVLAGTRFRWPVLVLSLLTFPYLLGLIARTRAIPHLLHPDRLELRSGELRLTVPRELIGSVFSSLSMRAGTRVRLQDGTLTIPSGGATDVALQLSSPLETPLGQVDRIQVGVDDPRGFVQAVRG